ncbi:unnamed protein product [Effrenium voratum]|nr:unnamed protein product [Effrenium voratum]
MYHPAWQALQFDTCGYVGSAPFHPCCAPATSGRSTSTPPHRRLADGPAREGQDEAKTKAKGWKRKSPSTWSVALAAPASLAAAADSGGQCLRRAPLPNDEGQETAITVPPDTRYLGDVPWQAGLGMFIQFIQSASDQIGICEKLGRAQNGWCWLCLKLSPKCSTVGCRGRAESEGSQRWVRSHFAAGQAKP